MMNSNSLQVLFYVQHLLGIGHLIRAIRIADALRNSGFDVSIVMGGLPLSTQLTSDLDIISLPPIAVHKGDFSQLLDENGNQIDDSFKQHRCQKLLGIYRAKQPQIVILEAYPFGRRVVRFELQPLIKEIEGSARRPLLIASIRDILQRRSKPGREEETVRLVDKHFDKVLVHGDPDFVTLEDSFALAHRIQNKIAYTGWISAPQKNMAVAQFDVVVSAGGGAVGNKLLRTAIEAVRQLPELQSWCVITGPNIDDDEYAALHQDAPDNVSIRKFHVNLPALLAAARLSISQAGYNTVSDVVQAACACVLVPYGDSGETEQTDRAARMAQLGLAHIVPSEQLNVPRLVCAIRDAVMETPPLTAKSVRTDGAAQTARILHELLQERRQ